MSVYQNPPIRRFNDIYNPNTLNIFADASIRNCRHERLAGCYGVVAVCMDHILYNDNRVHSDTTSNLEEARGVRRALSIALAYRNMFSRINIFSDSKLSICGLRDFSQGWLYHDNGLYKSKACNKPVANQEIFVEMYAFAQELLKTNQLGLYHIKGHVDFDKHPTSVDKSLAAASTSFSKENCLPFGLDINIVRYLCTYNDFVDHSSRSYLLRTNVVDYDVYVDPVKFIPQGPLYW